jgi:hypothetical protein
MKINATEIRVGMILEYKNDLWGSIEKLIMSNLGKVGRLHQLK